MKKMLGIVSVALVLSGCNSSKQGFLSGCRAGVYRVLESFGYEAENVDSGKVDATCQELESAKKSS